MKGRRNTWRIPKKDSEKQCLVYKKSALPGFQAEGYYYITSVPKLAKLTDPLGHTGSKPEVQSKSSTFTRNEWLALGWSASCAHVQATHFMCKSHILAIFVLYIFRR